MLSNTAVFEDGERVEISSWFMITFSGSGRVSVQAPRVIGDGLHPVFFLNNEGGRREHLQLDSEDRLAALKLMSMATGFGYKRTGSDSATGMETYMFEKHSR